MLSSTITLMAHLPATGELGIATASRCLAVGAVVPFLRSGVGAVATQHLHDPRIAFAILDDLEAGVDPKGALDRALRFFGEQERRQVAILMAAPQPGQTPGHAYTGSACEGWCGDRVNPGLILLGNSLANETVLAEAERGFKNSQSPHLSERLLDGLLAGQRAGGDKRGKQAAALRVVGGKTFTPPLIDLRVDDHPEAPNELHRIWILFQRQNAVRDLPVRAPLASL